MSYPSDSLTFDELRRANLARVNAFHALDEWSPTDWATAAAGELGELCNLIKKLRRGEDISRDELAHELADTVTYLDLLAARLGIDLGEATRVKFNLVSKRIGSDMRL